MKHVNVKSSNVRSVAYDPDKKLLEVAYLNGSHYHYHDVPVEKHKELMAADSVGSYLYKNIKNSFKCTRAK